ncbi:MAG: 7TM-DISM domain-containing protein, partial [Chloroflexota bacterium]
MKTIVFFVNISLVILFGFWVLTLAPLVQAQQPGTLVPRSIALQDDADKYPLSLHLDLLEDEAGTLSIEDVLSTAYAQHFRPNQERMLNLGITTSTYWLRFGLRNDSGKQQDWLLDIANPSLNRLDVYRVTATTQGGITITPYAATGSVRPFENRDIPHPRFLYKIDLASTEDVQFYVRVETVGLMLLPLTIWQFDAFQVQNQHEIFFWGIFFGVLGIMVFYNLFLYLSLKEAGYLYLTIFILGHILFRAVRDGWAGAYFSLTSGVLINTILLSVAGLIFLFIILFATSFLSTKQQTPKLHITLNIVMGIVLAGLLLLPLVSFRLIALTWLILSFPTIILLLWAAIEAWMQGYLPARFFILAVSVQFTIRILTTLSSLDLIPQTVFFPQIEGIGLILLVSLLSLALADRINRLKSSAEQANQSLREINEERARLLSSERQERLLSETLREVTLALTSNMDLNKILDAILQQAQRLTNYSAAHIALLEGDILRVARWNGYDQFQNAGLMTQLIQPLDDFPLDFTVIQSGTPLIYSDTHLDPNWVVVPETTWIRSHLSMPITSQNQVLGLLRLDGHQASQFTIGDITRLSPLVSAAAIALENARLLESEQQRSQALTEARDQALEANHLKSELLAKVSHELRTPLGSILGFSQILRRGIYGPLSDKQVELNNEVIDSTEYLTNMVNELLDQAQLDASRLKLKLSNITPKKIADDLAAKMAPMARNKNVTLDVTIDPALPGTLSVDPVRMQQILYNLVSNAIKFTSKGGVSVHFAARSDQQWQITVKDSGVGIPYQAQAHIFDPFFQVDGSETREQPGTGLGLSIVKQLVTLMQGKISVNSIPKQGSTFTISLPLKSILE